MKAEDVLDIFETKCLISNTQPVMEINTLIWYTNDRKYCIIAEYDDDTFEWFVTLREVSTGNNLYFSENLGKFVDICAVEHLRRYFYQFIGNYFSIERPENPEWLKWE